MVAGSDTHWCCPLTINYMRTMRGREERGCGELCSQDMASAGRAECLHLEQVIITGPCQVYVPNLGNVSSGSAMRD